MKSLESPAASRLAFGALVLIALISHWPALQWGYGNDDYALMHNGVDADLFVTQGRPMGWIIYRAMQVLGIPLAESSPAFQFIGNIVLAAFAWTVVRLWAPHLPTWQTAVAALPIIVHPYQSEIFSYRSTTLLTLFPVALATWFLHECRTYKSRWRLGAATVGLAFGFATYQGVVNYLLYALMLYAATIVALRGQPGRDRDEWRTWSRATLLSAVAVVVYVASMKLMWTLVPHASDARFDWRALPAVTARVAEMAKWGNTAFFYDMPLLSGTAKALALGIPLLALAWTMVTPAEPSRSVAPRSRVLFALVLGLLPAWFFIGGVSSLTPNPWIVPRVLAQAGLVYAWLFVLAFSRLRAAPPNGVVAVAFGAVCFIFTAMSVSTLSSQLRVNLRDQHQASRIFERLEATRGYADVDRLVVNGGRWAYGDRIKNVWGDLNVSAFIAPQSKGNLIVEISGAPLGASTQTPDVEKAREYCAHADPWPSPQSVAIIEKLAVVCMPSD